MNDGCYCCFSIYDTATSESTENPPLLLKLIGVLKFELVTKLPKLIKSL
jgi:hypothetical protein